MPSFASNILALDTTGRSCSAAAWKDGKLAARALEAMERGQSERLLPMVQEVMTKAGLAFEGLDALAVTLGPGGFTGVRIGLAAAQGFALAWDLPVIGVTSFEAVAHAVPPDRREGRHLAVLLESKRDDFFLQQFDAALSPLSAPTAVTSKALQDSLPAGPLLLAGDAAERALPLLSEVQGIELFPAGLGIDAAVVAGLAAAEALPEDPEARPLPLYLRAPDVTLPPGSGRWA